MGVLCCDVVRWGCLRHAIDRYFFIFFESLFYSCSFTTVHDWGMRRPPYWYRILRDNGLLHTSLFHSLQQDSYMFLHFFIIACTFSVKREKSEKQILRLTHTSMDLLEDPGSEWHIKRSEVGLENEKMRMECLECTEPCFCQRNKLMLNRASIFHPGFRSSCSLESFSCSSSV